MNEVNNADKAMFYNLAKQLPDWAPSYLVGVMALKKNDIVRYGMSNYGFGELSYTFVENSIEKPSINTWTYTKSNGEYATFDNPPDWVVETMRQYQK